MKKAKITIEERIVDLMDQDSLTKEESLELIEELYWADWTILRKKPDYIEKIFNYLKKDNFSKEEISKIFKLYNNLDGAYIEDFSRIILDIYRRDKSKFIRSLNIEREETQNLVYLFRNHLIDLDKDKELDKLIGSDKLTKEEKETGRALIKAYEHACST